MSSHRTPFFLQSCFGVLLASSLAGLACGTSTAPTTPPPNGNAVASVTIAPLPDPRLAVGRALQLSATVKNAAGGVVSATITWNSTDPTRAEVDASGQVSGRGAGGATITATASGKSANVVLVVVNANLSGIGTAANDPFLGGLVQRLSGALQPGMNQAIALCRSGAAAGDFPDIDNCLAQARTLMGTASDPTDKALVGSGALFFDYIDRARQ